MSNNDSLTLIVNKMSTIPNINSLKIDDGWRVVSRKRKFAPKRYRWKGPEGELAAGGILIIDTVEGEKGVWVLVEKSRRRGRENDVDYIDFGGKYDYNDCNIYATISREFREEVYNTDEISVKTIKDLYHLSPSNRKATMRLCRGQYVCLIVDRSLLPPLTLNSEKVRQARVDAIQTNPNIHDRMYRTEDLMFLPLKDATKEPHLSRIAYRLGYILKKCDLFYPFIPEVHKILTDEQN